MVFLCPVGGCNSAETPTEIVRRTARRRVVCPCLTLYQNEYYQAVQKFPQWSALRHFIQTSKKETQWQKE